jgi:hypothetical protein
LADLAAAHDRCEVFSGINDDALEFAVGVWRGLRTDRTNRQGVQGVEGVAKWSDMPGGVLEGLPPVLVVLDEPRSFLLTDKGDSGSRRALKSEFGGAWSELLQEGRSAGHHGLVLSQSPSVDSVGGGFCQEQLGMRLAVRFLDRKWHPVVFPDSEADLSLLVNAATPPGRAIGRGLIAPGTRFGSEDVQDAPLHLPLLDQPNLPPINPDEEAIQVAHHNQTPNNTDTDEVEGVEGVGVSVGLVAAGVMALTGPVVVVAGVAAAVWGLL